MPNKLDDVQVATLSNYIYTQISSFPIILNSAKERISLGLLYLKSPSKTKYKSQAIKNIISYFLLITFHNKGTASLHAVSLSQFRTWGLTIIQNPFTSNFTVI